MGILRDYILANAEQKKKEPAEWLSGTIKNAGKCVFATNVGKFTHPSSGSDIVFQSVVGEKTGSDYVGTDSIRSTAMDAMVSTAAYMPVAKLLLLPLEDHRILYEHLKEDDPALRDEFSGLGVDYDDVRDQLLEVQVAHKPSMTDNRLKQVYFPIDETYHLLTVVPSSIVLTEIKRRTDQASQQRRQARKKDSEHYGESYVSYPNLVMTQIGGTKPQNVSVLNNENHGSYVLLPSFPPHVQASSLPKHDFFRNSLQKRYFQESFQQINTFMAMSYHDYHIENAMHHVEVFIIDRILDQAAVLQMQNPGWTEESECQLPVEQKHWLDAQYRDEDLLNEEIDKIVDDAAHWMMRAYEWSIQKEAKKVLLDDTKLKKWKKAFRHALVMSR